MTQQAIGKSHCNVLRTINRRLDGAVDIRDIRMTDFVSDSGYVRANIDIEAARGNVRARAITERRISAARDVIN